MMYIIIYIYRYIQLPEYVFFVWGTIVRTPVVLCIYIYKKYNKKLVFRYGLMSKTNIIYNVCLRGSTSHIKYIL